MGSGKLLKAFFQGHEGIRSKFLETIPLETVRLLEEAVTGERN